MELPAQYFRNRAPLASTFGSSFQRAYPPVTEPLPSNMAALIARLDDLSPRQAEGGVSIPPQGLKRMSEFNSAGNPARRFE